MHIKELLPKPDERMFLVGQTGSGKTYAAERMLPHFPSVLALDPKCSLGGKKGLPGYKMIRRPSDLNYCRSDRIQVRLNPEHQTPDLWNSIYWWAYRRKNTMVYTDEVYLVLKNDKATTGMRACITSGRERGVGMIHACQRPATIPVIIRSECQRFGVFFLGHEDDRRTMYGHITHNQVLNAVEHEHAFWYYNEPERDLRYAKL